MEQVIKLWDVQTSRCIRTLESRGYWFAFSPDSKILASSTSNGAIELFDTKTGALLQTLTVPRLYEGMNITGATGLTDAQKSSLIALGAFSGE